MEVTTRLFKSVVVLIFTLLGVATLLAPVPLLGDIVPAQTALASGMHDYLSWSEYPSACRDCHPAAFADVYQGVHYQWQGRASDNVNRPGTSQGKINGAMNAYCINPLGNWTGCGKCHVGRGPQPVPSLSPTINELYNIDCLVCHNEAYAMARVRLPNGRMGPPASTPKAVLDGYVMNIAKPTRANCLKCHAFAGGGDGVKRGDLSSIQTRTADGNFDVHMATTRGNLACQACHTFGRHRVTGKGSDLVATDDASEVKCATDRCHPAMRNGGHVTVAVNSHVAHVACQTCHIPVYGKTATEIQRDWRTSTGSVGNYKPSQTKGSSLKPAYRWWNRKTENYLLGDSAVLDQATGAYSMERLRGGVTGDTTNKIYPFKYKTSYQPMRTTGKILIALDTNEYLNVSGNYGLSVSKGLVNMGFGSSDAYTTVKTDTYQLLNHTIADAQSARGVLACSDCHGSTSRIDLKGQLGYALKAPQSTTCGLGEDEGCHDRESWPGYASGHREHVTNEKLDCIYCHTFSRPERGLKGAVAYPVAVGGLAGTVSSGSDALAGVSVRVLGRAPMVTAADGSYNVTAIAPGTYSVTYDKPGYTPKTVSVVIGSGSTTTTNVSLAAGPDVTPVYRFYNRAKGVHFYTADEAEKNRTIANHSSIYTFEGVAFRLDSDSPDNAAPLYRFYNRRTGVHFYTASEAEKSATTKDSSGAYIFEGVSYLVCGVATPGSRPVYRFFNKRAGVHFYTADEAEKSETIERLSGTYVYEGVGYSFVAAP